MKHLMKIYQLLGNLDEIKKIDLLTAKITRYQSNIITEMDKPKVELCQKTAATVINCFTYAFLYHYREKRNKNINISAPFSEALSIVMHGGIYSLLGNVIQDLIPPYTFFVFNLILGLENFNLLRSIL